MDYLTYFCLLGIIAISGYIAYNRASKNSISIVKKAVEDFTSAANMVLKHVSSDIKYLNGQTRAIQSSLDSFKHEIGNNGVFDRLSILESDVLGSDRDSRIKAMENYMGVSAKGNTKKVEIAVPGLHYEKAKK